MEIDWDAVQQSLLAAAEMPTRHSHESREAGDMIPALLHTHVAYVLTSLAEAIGRGRVAALQQKLEGSAPEA